MQGEGVVHGWELQALKSRLGVWRVELGDEVASLAPVEGGGRISIARADTAGRLELHELWGGKGVLTLPKEGDLKKLQFVLDPEQRDAVDAWLGPRTQAHLVVMLRRRYLWAIPLGILLMVISVPMASDPASGLEAVPASPITAVLGAGLIGLWLLARLRPTPKLLIVDGVWLLLLLGSLVADVVAGRSSALWLLWGLALLILVRAGWREYERFKHLS